MSAIATTMRTAFSDAFAKRASFWTQLTIMAVNDVAWVVFWLIFFGRVGTVRGWDADLVLLLFAVLTTGAGLVLGLLSNSRRIPALVADGDLDEVLSLPVSPLPHLLVRRIDAVNLGDVAFGLVLFAVAGGPTPARMLTFVAGAAASALLLTGFLVAAGSLVFFIGRGQAGDLGLHAILLFASYPADVFAGYTRTMLYTVVPAAFVSAVPARLIAEFDAGDAFLLTGASLGFATLGVVMFTLGLRRYTSSSAWSRG